MARWLAAGMPDRALVLHSYRMRYESLACLGCDLVHDVLARDGLSVKLVDWDGHYKSLERLDIDIDTERGFKAVKGGAGEHGLAAVDAHLVVSERLLVVENDTLELEVLDSEREREPGSQHGCRGDHHRLNLPYGVCHGDRVAARRQEAVRVHEPVLAKLRALWHASVTAGPLREDKLGAELIVELNLNLHVRLCVVSFARERRITPTGDDWLLKRKEGRRGPKRILHNSSVQLIARQTR